MAIDWSKRSSQAEIMDDFEMKGVLLRDTLDRIATINRWLGSNAATLGGIKQLLKSVDKTKTISIVDLGCGSGDVLRAIAKFGHKKGLKFQLLGIDANADTLDYAAEQSEDFPEISFRKMDVTSADFKELKFDIAIATLFLHHFTKEQLQELLFHMLQQSTLGVVINDLHRHPLAYKAFKVISIFIKNKMVAEDGLTSILRAFRREDLEELSKELPGHHSISWKWAFRYLWIIRKN